MCTTYMYYALVKCILGRVLVKTCHFHGPPDKTVNSVRQAHLKQVVTSIGDAFKINSKSKTRNLPLNLSEINVNTR